MPISIKNSETEFLARKLADLTGESITDAVRQAVSERYDRLCRARSKRSMADDLKEIAARCASRPIISSLTDEEILGYDDLGIPTR